MSNKIYIIGIGDDGLAGLTPSAKEKLASCELVLGSAQLLESLADLEVATETLEISLHKMVEQIRSHQEKPLAILASGDPLFYGTARFLSEQIGKNRFVVVPHVSSMQLAFARLMESWDEAYLTNLANHPIEAVIDNIRIAEKVGIFTTETYTPAKIAKILLEENIDYFQGYVCENLGSPDERVTKASLKEIADIEFSPLNVLVLIRQPDSPDTPRNRQNLRLFGNPDELFLQALPQQVLITPAEVRAIALAELQLSPKATLWDVGAGSGSVAIEAAQIAHLGTTFAIEMNPDDYQLLQANLQHFEIKNVRPILGQAPKAWADLPTPEAIFVDGSGRNVETITRDALKALAPAGRMVVNIGNLESVKAVYDLLYHEMEEVSLRMVQISRGNYQLERLRLEALNPTFLLCAKKPIK
ncbi:MAG: precorrin-6y C5,15-methyltransferase (decarboxylating) subunit CbiE [Pirellulaceae bacterium]|nr:precorrin-6y C5,15-methyltransferase (decarboxylating) subunit CbiE [Pirellulaceae bacterium]